MKKVLIIFVLVAAVAVVFFMWKTKPAGRAGDEGAAPDGSVAARTVREAFTGEAGMPGTFSGGRQDDSSPGGFIEGKYTDLSDPTAAAEFKRSISTSGAGSLCRDLVDELKKGGVDRISALNMRIIQLGDGSVPDLILLLNCGDTDVEIPALRLLTQIGTAKATAAALGKVLTVAGSGEAGMKFLRQFASVNSPAVAAVLVGFLGRTDQPDLILSIQKILAELEGTAVVKELEGAIHKPVTQAQGSLCAQTMASLCKPSNISGLQEVLETSESMAAREAAANGLANIGNAQACGVLAKNAQLENSVSAFCLSAMAAVSSEYGQQTLLDIVAMDYNSAVRTAASRALGNYRSTHVRDQLALLAQGEEDKAVKKAMDQSVAAIDTMTAARQAVVTPPPSTGFVEDKETAASNQLPVIGNQ